MGEAPARLPLVPRGGGSGNVFYVLCGGDAYAILVYMLLLSANIHNDNKISMCQ